MRKFINTFYCILLLSSSVFFTTISFADSGLITPRSQDLKQQLDDITRKMERINSNSREVKAISEEFRGIAEEHADLVTSYVSSKAECQNQEDTFKQRRLLGRELTDRVLKYQHKTILECYKNLELITLNFDEINADFSRLSNKIQELKDVASIQQSTLSSLEKHLNVVTRMLKIEKRGISLIVRDLEEKIVTYTN